MNAYSHSFDSSRFSFEKNDFEPEKETCTAIFYMQEEVDPSTNELVKIEYVKIRGPGENLAIYGGKVRPEDKLRFARAYEAFKKGETLENGTSLSKWPEVSNNVDFLAQLRGMGFQTVEDVARMPDQSLRMFHGALTYRRKAQIFLDKQKEAAGQDAKDAAINELRAQLAAIQAQMDERSKNKGGRPRKVQPTETAA